MLQVHHHLRDNDATQSAARELGACWRPASTPDGLLRSDLRLATCCKVARPSAPNRQCGFALGSSSTCSLITG